MAVVLYNILCHLAVRLYTIPCNQAMVMYTILCHMAVILYTILCPLVVVLFIIRCHLAVVVVLNTTLCHLAVVMYTILCHLAVTAKPSVENHYGLLNNRTSVVKHHPIKPECPNLQVNSDRLCCFKVVHPTGNFSDYSLSVTYCFTW